MTFVKGHSTFQVTPAFWRDHV